MKRTAPARKTDQGTPNRAAQRAWFRANANHRQRKTLRP